LAGTVGTNTPTGVVTISDGVNTAQGPAPAGSVSFPFNTPGPDTLTATYSGDAHFSPSVSSNFAVTVHTEYPPAISAPTYALQFNSSASSYVTAPALPAFPALTIELWFKWADSGGDIEFLTSMGDANYEIQLGQGNNGLRFIPVPGVLIDTAPGVFTPGQWTHLACVYDPANNNGQIYINGVAQTVYNDGGPWTAPLATPASPLFLGRRTDGSYLYNGAMDEVRIWSAARTAGEIQANYLQELSGPQTNLVAYYKFDEGSGTVASDSSGNGLNGTLVNGPVWIAPGAALAPLNPVVVVPSLPGSAADIQAVVASPGGDPLTAVWSLNGVPAETNFVASGGSLTSGLVAFTNALAAGTNRVTLSVADGVAAPTLASLGVFAATVATISVSPPSPAPGYPATVSYTVAGTNGSLAPSGVVTISDGVTAVQGAAPAGSVSFPFNSAGPDTLVATYSGDASFASCAATTNVTVHAEIPPTIAGPGSALQFDAASQSAVVAPVLPAFSAQTIELWFKWEDNGNLVEFATSMGLGNGEIQLAQTLSRLFYEGYTSVRFLPAPGVYLDTPLVYSLITPEFGSAASAFAPGQWTHLACVYDPANANAQIYINGVPQPVTVTGSLTTPLVPPAQPLQLGLRSDGTYPFNGELDDVRIWNIARTAAEIQASYQQEIPSPQTGLVAYYKFDEGGGTVAGDSSGNGFNATLTNGPSWSAPGAVPGLLATNLAAPLDSPAVLQAVAGDLDSLGLTAVWAVNGAPEQTNIVAAGGGGALTRALLSFTNILSNYPGAVTLSVSDGVAPPVVATFTEIAPSAARFVSGDAIIANRSYYLGNGEIMSFRPSDGQQRLLNTSLKDAYTVAFDTNGDLLVADYQTLHGSSVDGGIFRIDRNTLGVSIVSQDPGFATPFGVAVEPDNQILVADLDANVSGAVFRVDPGTGVAATLSTGGEFYWLGGVAVSTNAGSETIRVTDHGDGTAHRPPAVIAIDPVSGAQTVLATNGYLRHPDGLAVNASGNIIVADSLAKALIMVDQSGNQTLLTPNAPFAFPTHVAIDPVSGDYFVTDGDPTPSTLADVSGVGALWRVNHTTFETTQISAGGFFEQPRGIVIQH
jgi:hypothetical protein